MKDNYLLDSRITNLAMLRGKTLQVKITNRAPCKSSELQMDEAFSVWYFYFTPRGGFQRFAFYVHAPGIFKFLWLVYRVSVCHFTIIYFSKSKITVYTAIV